MLGRYNLGQVQRTMETMPEYLKLYGTPAEQQSWLFGGGMGPSTDQVQAGGDAEGAELTPVPGEEITTWTSADQRAYEAGTATGTAPKPGNFGRIFSDPRTKSVMKWGGIAGLAYFALVSMVVIPARIRGVRHQVAQKYSRAIRRVRRVKPHAQPKGFFGRLFGKPTAEKLGQRAEKKSRRRWAHA